MRRDAVALQKKTQGVQAKSDMQSEVPAAAECYSRARILGKVDSVLASLSFSGLCFLTLQGLSRIVTSLPQQPILTR